MRTALSLVLFVLAVYPRPEAFPRRRVADAPVPRMTYPSDRRRPVVTLIARRPSAPLPAQRRPRASP